MGSSFLDAVLDATQAAGGSSDTLLAQFLREPSDKALALWLGLSPGDTVPRRQAISNRLCVDIALIDQELNAQVNAILHHARFQALEASWRGLKHLCGEVDQGDNIKIRVLTATWKELTKDLDRDLEQSHLFRKVYSEEFGTSGGEPYGVLLADYSLRHRPAPGHPTDDLPALQGAARLAAAAFAPFIAAIDPEFLGLDSFRDLERPIAFDRVFEQPEYTQWRSLRAMEESRFLGLTAPRVLVRLPYRDDGSRAQPFSFREETSTPDGGDYLWGTPVYAFGEVLVRAFAECGWLADIRGVRQGLEGGGLVTGLAMDEFATDAPGVAPKCSTDVVITDALEKQLTDLGIIPLCHCHGTPFAAFYGNQSVQEPKKYDTPAATVNAKLSGMLQYMLCVARFAHYVKVIGRDKTGSFATAQECQDYLNNWLVDYSTSAEDAPPELQSKYPLREASVTVREQPGNPGVYLSVVHLKPHFQLDQMTSSVKLVTELFAATT